MPVNFCGFFKYSICSGNILNGKIGYVSDMYMLGL
jgi:hypothetical protein